MANPPNHDAVETTQRGGNPATAKPGCEPSTDAGYVAGVDIGGTNLRLALADRSGAIVARWSSSTEGVRGADAVVELICDGVERLLQQTPIPRNSLKAIAVGVPGVTDVEEGRVISTSYLLGRHDVPLAAMLEAELNSPVAAED